MQPKISMFGEMGCPKTRQYWTGRATMSQLNAARLEEYSMTPKAPTNGLRELSLPPLLVGWLEHAEELLSFVSEFAGKAIMAPDTPHDKESAKVVAFKFTQAVRSFRAVRSLLRNGDATNSFILCRSILENLVDSAFLVRNPAEVWRYLEEAADLESKLVSASVKYGPNGGDPTGAIHRRVPPEVLRKQFGELADQHSSFKSWKKINLRLRAERTGNSTVPVIYEMIYPVLSSYAHGSSTILLDYLRGGQGPDTAFRVEYISQDSELETAAGWCSLLFLNFLMFLDALFEMGLRNKLEELMSKQEQLMTKTGDEMLRRREGPKTATAADTQRPLQRTSDDAAEGQSR